MTKNGLKLETIPFYLQLAQDVKNRIRVGEFKTGNKLPTELELLNEWSVSRQTVRSALAELEKENLIYRIPSKGTFVNDQSKGISVYQDHKKKRKALKKTVETIGVLVPCVTISLYPGIVRGAEEIAHQNDYHTIIGNYDSSPEKEQKYIEMFIERGVKGVISAPSYNSQPESYFKLLKAGIPLVLVDINVPKIHTDLVTTDNIEGGCLATEILIKEGCRKIGFICGKIHTSSSQERLLGYRRSLQENNIDFDSELVKSGIFTFESAHQLAKRVIERNADGIFIVNENLAAGVMKAITEDGNHLKAVSFDEPRIPPSLPFPLAFITQSRQEIGKAAGRLLLERIKKGRAAGPIKKIGLVPKVIKFFEKRNDALEEIASKQTYPAYL